MSSICNILFVQKILKEEGCSPCVTLSRIEGVPSGFHEKGGDEIKKRKLAGSITVEASFAVPIFFLVAFSFMYLFEAIFLQNDLQKGLAHAAREYAAYGKKRSWISSEQRGYFGIQWDTDSEKKICSCTVIQSIPSLPGQFFPLRLYQQIALNNYKGKSMIPESGNGEGVYVYVAENGTVYHRDIGCAYLRLGIKEVNMDQIGIMRNRSGGKYKACERCLDGDKVSNHQTVYITPYGIRYHSKRDCSGLRRTIRKLELSQVSQLPPCSKCGNRR